MNEAAQNLNIQKKIAALSIILFVIKIAAWYITNSVAILTDALESIVNVVAGLVGVYSLYISAKPRDTDHPYGHGKVEFISAAVEGTLIFVAGIFIIYRAVKNFTVPHQVYQIDFGIILITATGVINFIAGTVCERVGVKNKSLPLIASGNHLKTDTYTTFGIIAGLILLYFTKIIWIDSAVAILFAFIILYTGYRIIRSSISGIMDEADVNLLKEMVATLNDNRRYNWMDIHNVRIIKYGATLHIDAHLTVPWYFNVNEAHDEIEEVTSLLRKNYGHALEIFIHSDACMAYSCPICIKPDCRVRQHQLVRKIEWSMENISADAKHSVNTIG